MDFRMPMLSASIQSATHAGGIDQTQWNAADGDGLADQVARCARLGGDDGALALDEAVEQARLAYVGPAHDGQRQSFVHHLAEGEAGRSSCSGARTAAMRARMCALGITETSSSAKSIPASRMRDQLNQLLLDRLQPLRKRAFQLLRCNLGLNSVCESIRSRTASACARSIRPLRKARMSELARLSQARAASQR